MSLLSNNRLSTLKESHRSAPTSVDLIVLLYALIGIINISEFLSCDVINNVNIKILEFEKLQTGPLMEASAAMNG